MKMRYSLFKKIIAFIFVLIIPALVIYGFSYKASVDVIQNQIQNVKLNELDYFSNEINHSLMQTSAFANQLVLDNDIRMLSNKQLLDDQYDVNKIRLRVLDKLNMFSISNKWNADFTIYYNSQEETLSSSSLIDYDRDYLSKAYKPYWHYTNRSGEVLFSYFITYPYVAKPDLNEAQYVVEVRVRQTDIENMLTSFQKNGEGGLFLYSSGTAPIVNGSANVTYTNEIIHKFNEKKDAKASGHLITTLGGKKYFVVYSRLEDVNWFLIHYIPLGGFLDPIKKTKDMYYLANGVLLTVSVLLAISLYGNVQKPIIELIRGLQKIKMGDYSAKITMKTNSEFHFVFTRFNEMSNEIRDLIERVFLEQIRSKEAKLRQLQSQINPHFLYNSLAFIKSMAELDQKSAVIDMAVNLSKFYRASIKDQKQMTTLKDEVLFVTSYLEVQSLQTDRFYYEINIDERMDDMPIPRLILQPLVENAIIHGIEPMTGYGQVVIQGHMQGNECMLSVVDNGVGIELNRLSSIQEAIYHGNHQQLAWGLSNVHERISNFSGMNGKLLLERVPTGGIKATLRWTSQLTCDLKSLSSI